MLQPHLNQARETACSKHLCGRGPLIARDTDALRLSEVIQGVAVAAERHRVDEAGGEQGERHALEEPSQLRRHRENVSGVFRQLVFLLTLQSSSPLPGNRFGTCSEASPCIQTGPAAAPTEGDEIVITRDIFMFMAFSVIQPSRCPMGVQLLSPQHLQGVLKNKTKHGILLFSLHAVGLT